MEFLTAIGTILGVAAALFFRDIRDGKHPFRKNGTAESAKYIKELRDSQLKLQEHFNDETTAVLKGVEKRLGDIHDCLETNNRQLFEHITEENSFQREMRDFMRGLKIK